MVWALAHNWGLFWELAWLQGPIISVRTLLQPLPVVEGRSGPTASASRFPKCICSLQSTNPEPLHLSTPHFMVRTLLPPPPTASSSAAGTAPRSRTAATQTNQPAPEPPVGRVRNLWRRAVRHIVLLFRLRRKWSALGRHLQLPRIHTLFTGFQRDHGRLRRVSPAPTP